MRRNFRNNEDAGDLTMSNAAGWSEAQAEERDDENYAFGGQHQADIAAEERAERAAEKRTNSTRVHPFEKAGLGSAPFRCTGMHVEVITHGIMNPVSVPAGTCDYCGTGIKYVYDIVSSDGVTSGVGCECVLKTSGAASEDTSLVRQVKSVKRDLDRKLRQERKAKKDAARREANEATADDILENNPELAKALETDHYIIRDIASRLRQWGNISQAQINLVFKIADQVADKKAQEDSMIDVPRIAGRQTITGKVVATKWDTVYYGYNSGTTQLKGLIIVDTPEGQWKTWGTISESICESFPIDTAENIKGVTIQFDAKVKVAPNDSKMSFFSRPSKGTVVK